MTENLERLLRGNHGGRDAEADCIDHAPEGVANDSEGGNRGALHAFHSAFPPLRKRRPGAGKLNAKHEQARERRADGKGGA